MITGTGWRRGGGAAAWAPVAMRLGRPRRLQELCRAARKAKRRRRSREDRPSRPLRAGPWLQNHSEPERPTSGVGPGQESGADRTRRTARGRRATGILKLNELVPGVLLPCSLTVPSCEARRRRGIARATALFPAYSPSYTGASRVRLSFLSRQKPSRSLPHAPLEPRRRLCRRAPRRRRRASAGPRRAAEPGAGPALLRGGGEGGRALGRQRLWRPRRAPPAERRDGRVHAPLLRRRRPRRSRRPGSAGRLPGPRPALARLRRRSSTRAGSSSPTTTSSRT